MVLYFIGVYVINRTLHGRLEIQNFSDAILGENQWWRHEILVFFSGLRLDHINKQEKQSKPGMTVLCTSKVLAVMQHEEMKGVNFKFEEHKQIS